MNKCGLFWVGGTLFLVGGVQWGCMGDYFGLVGGVGMSKGGWGSVGVDALFDNAH